MTPSTIYTNIVIFSLLSISTVNAAGPHNRFNIGSHRRHHAKAAIASQSTEETSPNIQNDLIEKRDECTLGAWKCVGSELQRCYNDQWNFVTNCTGKDIICSDGLYTTGCVWTWSVQQNDDANESATSSPPFTSSISATSTSSAALSVTASITNVNLAADPTPTAGSEEDDEEECDDEEEGDEDQDDEEDDNTSQDDSDLPYCDEIEGEDDSTTPATPAVTTATPAGNPTPSAAPSVIGGELIAGGDAQSDSDNSNEDYDDGEDYDNDDDEECEEYDSDSESASPATTSSAATTSIIGGQLWAGDHDSWDQTASATTHDWYSWDNQATSTSASEDWNTWNQPSATATATSSQEWGNGHGHGKGHKSSSADRAASTSASWDQWNDGASTTTWDDWSGQPTTSAAWGQETDISSYKSGKGSATASAGASASSAASGKNNHTIGSPSGSYTSAPHYVIYSDYWLFEMPSVEVLSNFNRFILAFWMTDRGAVDNAQFWEQLDSTTRQQVITDYHNAGIALMVSAFGSTDSPTSNGADPTQTAQNLAKWVKDYGLDGVDIDYEDMPAMNSAQAVAWLVTFQKELRRLLPSPYVISHAPVAPWFTSANDYSDGAYVAIHQQTGDGIDFYNIQFYNQGTGVYEDCETLLFNSGNDWPSTSVFEINSSAGLPLDKIVIGKPLDEGAAANGFVDPSVLKKCVSQAKAKGWNAGVMFWEWTTSAPSIMGTVRGSN